MTKIMMNTKTGSVDTYENWLSDFKSSLFYEWFGFDSIEKMKEHGGVTLAWDDNLVEVEKNDNGDWVEIK